MNAETAVAAWLSAVPAITALVGQRIYAVVAPEEDTPGPKLVFRLLDGGLRERTIHPPVPGDRTAVSPIAITCVAPTYAQLKQLVMAVLDAMETMPPTVAGVRVYQAELLDRGGDNYAPEWREFYQEPTFNLTCAE